MGFGGLMKATRNETGRRNGFDYRLIRRGSVYWLATRCDCLFGPHWHEHGSYRKKTEARAVLDSMHDPDTQNNPTSQPRRNR